MFRGNHRLFDPYRQQRKFNGQNLYYNSDEKIYLRNLKLKKKLKRPAENTETPQKPKKPKAEKKVKFDEDVIAVDVKKIDKKLKKKTDKKKKKKKKKKKEVKKKTMKTNSTSTISSQISGTSELQDDFDESN